MVGPRPHLIFIAGVNGAGKSTFMADFQRAYPGELEIFNPDAVSKKIAAKHPEYGRLALWKDVVKELGLLLSSMKNIALETTLSGAATISQIRQAKQDGYRVEMIFLALDRLEIHIQRVKNRVQRGGHDIPVKDIERRFDTSYANLKKITSELDGLKIYDNTPAPGEAGSLRKILEIKDGKVICMGELSPRLKQVFPQLKPGHFI